MTNEEFERIKNSIRAKSVSQPDPEAEKARRKLDRDMDRIERALTACLKAPRRPPTPSEADKRLAKVLAELAERRSRRSRSRRSLADKWLEAQSKIVRRDRDEPSS